MLDLKDQGFVLLYQLHFNDGISSVIFGRNVFYTKHPMPYLSAILQSQDLGHINLPS